MRDPDGYYIEFCACSGLEEYLVAKLAENDATWDVPTTMTVLKYSRTLKDRAIKSKHFIQLSELGKGVRHIFYMTT